MRDISTLHMPHEELFARVVEGICPGCSRPLEIRDLAEPEMCVYSDRCGWCELCCWGWSAVAWRTEIDPERDWQSGEHLVTVYAEGAVIMAKREPRSGGVSVWIERQ